jgi:hypothetical protein
MIGIDDTPPSSYPSAAMPKKRTGAVFRVVVGVRLTPEDAERLDAIHARIPVASRHAIAREAMRIGLDALEKNPGRLVDRERVPVRRRKK